MDGKYLRLHFFGTAIAFGIMTAVAGLLICLCMSIDPHLIWASRMSEMMIPSCSFGNALLIAVKGFIFGFILGAVFAYFYNLISCKKAR